MANTRLEEIRKIRLEKTQKLRELGIDPYPAKAQKSTNASEILGNFEKFEGKSVHIAGRIMSWREHGALVFAHLQDDSGQIQLFIQQDKLAITSKEKQNLGFSDLNLLDIGDFIEVSGEVTKTVRGEISVVPKTIKILTKSIRPLPSEWHGLKDEEARYRQRYVDLILNKEIKDLLKKKTIFWNSMRDFLENEGFLEVETPVLENTAGGADASPFVTHHEALDIDLYLRISMGELWQKRLMVAGFEKTFEIGRQFRNEGISREHLQDYTQMEFYWAYANYEDSMKLVESMYKHVAKTTFGKTKFKIGKFEVDLDKDWERIDYQKIVLEKTGLDILKVEDDEIKVKLSEKKIRFEKSDQRARLVDLLWKDIRKSIAGPAFLTGHPVEVSPLAKRDPRRLELTERYQIILAGSEMGNGYSELNDPVDQAKRFEAQQMMRDAGDAEAQMHDSDFVRALEYGMPPVTGFGVSERLFSFLADKPIRETVFFPLLRPEEGSKKNE